MMSTPSRRLSDLLGDVAIVEAQLHSMRETAGPHRIRDVGVRLSALHRQLDRLERRLRLRARTLGEDDQTAMSAMRRRLALLSEDNPTYRGPERRWRNQDRITQRPIRSGEVQPCQDPACGYAATVELLGGTGLVLGHYCSAHGSDIRSRTAQAELLAGSPTREANIVNSCASVTFQSDSDVGQWR